jgi:hypothetical protein
MNQVPFYAIVIGGVVVVLIVLWGLWHAASAINSCMWGSLQYLALLLLILIFVLTIVLLFMKLKSMDLDLLTLFWQYWPRLFDYMKDL